MFQDRLRFIEDLQRGSVNGVKYDTQVVLSRFNHPSLVSNLIITGSTPYTGAQLFVGGASGANATKAGAWVSLPSTGGPAAPNQTGVLYTAQTGDTLDIPVTGIVQADIQLAGMLTSGMGYHAGDTNLVAGVLRNGGIAQVLVDGTPVPGGSADLYLATPLLTVFLSGSSTTLRIKHTGTHGALFNPLGSVTPLVGSSVANATAVQASSTQTTFTPATWTITCTTTGGVGVGKYRLDRTLPGGAPVTIASNVFVSASAVDSNSVGIPGVSLVVNGTLTLNDSATVVTDRVMVAVLSVKLYSGSGGVGGTYTTPIFDSGDPRTRWFYMDWKQFTTTADPLASVDVRVGNDVLFNAPPLPPAGTHQLLDQSIYGGVDPTSAGVDAGFQPSGMVLSDGLTEGFVGLQSLPPARYLQATFTLPSLASTQIAWLRDPSVYSWVPTPVDEPDTLGTMRLPANVVLGETLQTILGTYLVAITAQATAIQDFCDSLDLAKAVDAPLFAQGADRELIPYTGESVRAFARRVSSFNASRPTAGGGALFILQQAVQIVRGVSVGIDPQQPGVVVVFGGLTTFFYAGFILTQTSIRHYTLSIPPPPYAGLITLPTDVAQAMITDYLGKINPVGSVQTLVFN